MIYSRRLQNYIPTTIEKTIYESDNYRKITKYTIKDGKIPVGRVSLSDLPNGVFVEFIENFQPKLYKNVGKVADQIEVEHCLKRNLNNFEIISKAALNSHALHYLRGKRFIPENINKIIENIIKNTPKNKPFQTQFLGPVEMYMPIEMIKKYIDIIKNFPLLK